MIQTKKYTILLLFIAILFRCGMTTKEPTDAQLSNWYDWKEDRVQKLKEPDGFLNLAGLYWLKEGVNTFGSDSSNDVVYPPELPGRMGSITWEGESVTFSGLIEGVLVDSVYRSEAVVYHTDSTQNADMTYGSYWWYVIERAGNVGIRLKDLDHPKLKKDLNIKYYDFNPDLVIQADFVPYTFPRKLTIDNVLGHQFEMEISGQLRFEMDGQIFTMEPIDEGDEFFIIFSDETSAIETYGSGRYMYAHRPKGDEKVLLDFNRCYNPPCAFTDFATCWLPPRENNLEVRIDAGELDYHF